MGDTHHDPTDHFRTTHPHAGESMIDVYFWPGLFLVLLGVSSVVGGIASAAYRHHEWLGMTGLVALVALTAGALWITHERRRIRRIESEWLADHPGHDSGGRLA